MQLFIFPVLARRVGVLRCFRLSSLVHPICYFITPFTALLPTTTSQQIAMFVVMLVRGCGVVIAFPCNSIMLTNSASSPRLLGVLNGVGTTASAIGASIGPTIGGFTFSLGMDIGYGILPWWILACLAILGAVPIWLLKDTLRTEDDNNLNSTVNNHHPAMPLPANFEEDRTIRDRSDQPTKDKPRIGERETLSESNSNNSP